MGLGGAVAQRAVAAALERTGLAGQGLPTGAAAVRRLAPTDRHRPRDGACTGSADPRRTDRRPRSGAPRADVGAARTRSAASGERRSCFPRTTWRKPNRAIGSFCWRTAGSWPPTRRRRSWARSGARSWKSKVPARTDAARALQAVATVLPDGQNRSWLSDRDHAVRTATWRGPWARHRGLPGLRFVPPRWRTSTSPRTGGTDGMRTDAASVTGKAV